MKRLPITLLVLLTGCASYTAKPLDPGGQQTALEARRLDAPQVRQFVERSLGHELAPWPPKAWDLDALTLAAYSFHPDLDRAQAQQLVAEAAIVTAGARPNPTAGVSFQRNMDAPAGQSPWTNGLGLDIPIETAGKRDYRIDQARYLAQAAKLREAEAVWQVRSRVRASLLAAYPTEALVRRQRDLQEGIARMLERRFAAGFASQPELTQARLTLDRSILALRENQKQGAENLARLAAAVGVPAAALQGVEISYDTFEQLPPVSALPPAEVRRAALLSRPDVLAALADYEASQSALQLEIARQYPDVALGPGYVWDAGQVKWSLGLSLVLPLLNRNEGPIAEAKARREQAAAAFLAVQAKAIAEVDEALAGYGHAVQMVETAEALLRGQQKTERAVAAAFRAGESDRLAWLSAQYETATAELARVNALSQAQQTLGRLEDALRRPIGPHALAVTADQVISSKPRPYEEQP
ncbi:TolC family protein [Thiobacillus sp. 0-1251]|uniref:TolC family protein n=1 Tax=Thiobacillus sp. 0-1251 TaxID=1895858 RepID=UPI000965075E|nr:TolC family protein [Thiobacillus sp. 0-1251]OJY58431.1 MAG: transporter [Thiobacillus sp. 0-1251]